MATQGNDNDVSFSISVDSGSAESGLQKFSKSIEALTSLLESQSGKVGAASGVFESLGSTFDKTSTKVKGLLDSISSIKDATKTSTDKTASVVSLVEAYRNVGDAAKGAADKMSVFKDIKMLGQGEINSLLGGIKAVQGEASKGVSIAGIETAFQNATKVVGATEEQIKAFGNTRMPDFSPVVKELGAVNPSGIIGVTNEFIKLQSVITPTVEQLKLAVGAIGSLKAPDLSKVTEALRTTSQAPFSGMQAAAPKITSPSLSDVQKALGIGREQRTADVFSMQEQAEAATRNVRRNTRRERPVVDLGFDLAGAPDFLKTLNKEGTMADVLPFNTKKITEEQRAKNEALKEKLTLVREERRVKQQIADELSKEDKLTPIKTLSKVTDYATVSSSRTQSEREAERAEIHRKQWGMRRESVGVYDEPLTYEVPAPWVPKSMRRRGRASTEPSSTGARGSTSNPWRDVGDIAGFDPTKDMPTKGNNFSKKLREIYNPDEVKALRQTLQAEMEKLKSLSTIPQFTKASRVRSDERMFSLITRGTSYTPEEEIRLYGKERALATQEKTKIDRREARKQDAAKREADKYESRGGFLGQSFGALFGGSAVTSFTGLGGIARALNEPLLKSFGAVGLIASGVVEGILSSFSIVGKVASTVASVIFGTFQAAFLGIGAVAAVGLAGVATAFAGVKKLADSTFAAFEKGRSLSNLSDSTGVAVSKMLQLEKAFSAAGLKGDAVSSVLEQMSRTIYATSISKSDAVGGGVEGISPKVALKGLKLDAKQLAKMPEEQAFLKIGAAINNLASPIQRSAASMAIFRIHGAQLLALFSNSGAMNLVTERLTNTNQILAARAGTFRSAAERLEKVRPPSFSEGLSQIGVGIADKVVAEFMAATAKMGRIDLSFIGQAIGGEFAIAIESFRSGKMLQYLKDSMLVFVEYAKEKISTIFTGVGPLASQLLTAAQDFGTELLSEIDQVYSSISGESLLPDLSGVVGALSDVASIMISLGVIVLDATAALSKWAEKAALLITQFNKKYVSTKDVVGGAIIGGVGGAVAGIPAGPVGMVTLGLGGMVSGAVGGAALAGTKNADLTNTIFTDDRISALQAKFEAMGASLDSANNAVSSNIKAMIDEAAARRQKSKEERDIKVLQAEINRQKATTDAAQKDYDLAKKMESGKQKRNGEIKESHTASVVATSMTEIGGGGGFFSSAGTTIEDEMAQTAENTKSSAEYLKVLAGEKAKGALLDSKMRDLTRTPDMKDAFAELKTIDFSSPERPIGGTAADNPNGVANPSIEDALRSRSMNSKLFDKLFPNQSGSTGRDAYLPSIGSGSEKKGDDSSRMDTLLTSVDKGNSEQAKLLSEVVKAVYVVASRVGASSTSTIGISVTS